MSPGFYTAVVCRVVATASALFSGVVALRLYGKHLEPETYGTVLVALQVLSYLPLLDGGFRTTINRGLLANTDAEERRELIRFGQTFYSFLMLAVVAVGLLAMLGYGMTPMAAAARQPLVFFIAIGLSAAVAFIGSAQIGLLVGLQAQSEVFLLAALNSWLNVGALWLSFRNGAGVWAFAIATVAGFAGTYPVALLLLRRREPGLRLFHFQMDGSFRSFFHRLKRDAWACFRSQISIMLLFTLDVIFVGALCGPKDAAAYGVLTRLFGIIRNFLQATGEAAWPIVAQKGADGAGFTNPLLRINAWLYGGVMGAVALTLIPFLHWFMGAAWTTAPLVLHLVIARFLITGLSSPAVYFLMGLGQFKIVARHIERELVAACVLTGLLGWWLGMRGVAAAFLLATFCGTLTPIFHAYAVAQRISTAKLLAEVWWRALAGGAASFFVARGLAGWGSEGPRTIAVGAAAAVVATVLGLLCAAARVRFGQGVPLPEAGLRGVLKQM